jgi:capsular exopolysaccharide synthesis family protein
MATVESYTLRDILRLLFSYKVFFIVLPIPLVIGAYVSSELKTPMYESSVRMFIKAEKKTESEFYRGLPSRSIVSDHAELVISNTVLGRVVDALKLYMIPPDDEKISASPLKRAMIEFRQGGVELQNDERKMRNFALQRLGSRIRVSPVKDSNIFIITVKDYDPRSVIRIANSVSRSYVIFDLEQQIEETKLKYGEKNPAVLQLKDYINDFKKTLGGELLPDLKAIGPASVKIIAQAEGANLQKKVPKSMLMMISFITGIFLAASVAVISEYASNTFSSPRQAVEHLNLPFLGSIPKGNLKDLLIQRGSTNNSKHLKAFQSLSDKLSVLFRDESINTVMVTDSEGSIEAPIITSNIGMLLANNTGRRILIIDADFRQSAVTGILNVKNDMGLADVFEKNIPITNAIINVEPNLYILPSGQTSVNPVIILDSPKIGQIMSKLKDQFDLILISCPDLRNYTDALILSSLTDATVIVINEGKVRKQIFDNAIAPLKQRQVNILGIILSNRKYVIPSLIYKIS